MNIYVTRVDDFITKQSHSRQCVISHKQANCPLDTCPLFVFTRNSQSDVELFQSDIILVIKIIDKIKINK